jgi:hypothetical protein
MDEYFEYLGLPADASLEDARVACEHLREEFELGTIATDSPKTYHRSLSYINTAWRAIQEHFGAEQKSTAVIPTTDVQYSTAELLVKAKANQEYRREQPRGALRLARNETLLPGMFEEYERERLRHLGYVFDGPADVTRKDGMDIVSGSPTFKNTIFTRSVKFTPRRALTTAMSNNLRFPKPSASGIPTLPVTFREAIVFEKFVQFEADAVFEGPVEFKEYAVFHRSVTFYEKPTLSGVGFTRGPKVNDLWMKDPEDC